MTDKLSPADLTLIDGHAELRGLQAQLASEQSVLDSYDKDKAGLVERLKTERAGQWEQRRTDGTKGRRPILPAETELAALQERREAAELAVEVLPSVIEKVKSRLTADLLAARAAKPDIDKLGQDLAAAKELAERLLATFDSAVALKESIEATQSRLVRSWSLDLGDLPTGWLGNLTAAAALLRPALAAMAPAVTDPELAVLARRGADEAGYRKQLAEAARKYKASPKGRKDWATMSNIAVIVGQARSSVRVDDPGLKDTLTHAQAAYDLFHESACKFAGITARADLFPKIL